MTPVSDAENESNGGDDGDGEREGHLPRHAEDLERL
jgi:hypothetical protein